MPKTKEQKKQIIEDLKNKLSKQKIIIFSDFTGLSFSKMQALRKDLKKQEGDFKVAKKTLIKKAFEGKNFGIDPRDLIGEIGLVFGYKDEAGPAKIIYKFAKENEKVFKIIGAILGNEFMEKEKVVKLAKLPSYQELLGKFVNVLNAPLSGFANALQGNLRNLVYVLNAINKK